MLSFGLVNIPVSLFSATRKKEIRFNQLRKSDYSRIKYKKVGHDGEEVQQTDIVKGYEVIPDTYVVVEESELLAISPKASRVIEIVEFARGEEIDTRLYDASYYLAPTEASLGKAYALLLEAMSKAGVIGIAKFVLRSREYLAAIRPVENALMLTTMLFADEIVPAKELKDYLPNEVELADKEVSMARHLIDNMIVEFQPEKYKNQYHEQVMSLIEKKASENMVVSEPTDNGSSVVNLMAALEASMAQIKQNKKPKRKTNKSA